MRKINTPIMKFGFVVSAILVIFVVWSMFVSFLRNNDVQGINQTTDQNTQQENYNAYINTDMGFSASIPKEFTEQPDYFYYALGPAHEIPGVKFNIPESMATGTNLSSDSGISIELLSRAACTPNDFLSYHSTSTPVNMGEYKYMYATSSDAGAGNIYDESIFVYENSDLCYGVRYFIHSMQIGNYPEGTVTDFDKKALLDTFDGVLRSIHFI